MKKLFLFMLLNVVIMTGTGRAQLLTGFASLPADTFEPGPTSGQFIMPANGRIPPFIKKQPVQGVSSVLKTSGGDYLVMSDNGFGTKESSPDYVLRVHRIVPRFKVSKHGGGSIEVESFITLHDPNRKINFPIVADAQFYPNSTIEVDSDIRRQAAGHRR